MGNGTRIHTRPQDRLTGPQPAALPIKLYPHGADGGTRTRTPVIETWTSTMPVYQFQHISILTYGAGYETRTRKRPPRWQRGVLPIELILHIYYHFRHVPQMALDNKKAANQMSIS